MSGQASEDARATFRPSTDASAPTAIAMTDTFVPPPQVESRREQRYRVYWRARLHLQGGRARRVRVAVREAAQAAVAAASFCMIFCTFSSSVALVKGFTM